MARRRRPDAATLGLLPGQVPSDHARQTLADSYAALTTGAAQPVVADLGCGPGGSLDVFRAANPAVRWIGLDVPGSPEAALRTRTDGEFLTFDGARIPLADGSVDLVYCKQVLEHVSAPAPLLADVRRVLRPGGRFAGSTSQLEPFHSLSTGNHTPYGLRLLLEGAGLELLEIRPGIDALTLILRRARGGGPRFDRWWARESPLNRLLSLAGRVTRRDAEAINAAKLLFAGQFCFLARRPG
jgi:SAM-dependent methyltransferase